MLKSMLFVMFFTLFVFAEEWEPVPLITREMRDAGVELGGEGCQVILTIDIAPSNHELMLMGTNTGGIFRSENAGELWQPCNLGYDPRGGGDFEFDPKNENRVLAIGDAGNDYSHHGIYLSTDAGKSWRAVLNVKYEYNNPRNQLAWDVTSYEKDLGYCTTAYWAFGGGEGGDPAIYKSTDGGETWDIIYSGFGRGTLDIDTNGELYYAGEEGLFSSATGGDHFDMLLDGRFTGLDILPGYPEHIYACTETEIVISRNKAIDFEIINPKTFSDNQRLYRITVSPADPQNMLISYQYKDGWWQFKKYRSDDGGVTWKNAENYDNSLSFMPRAERDGPFEWHPAEKNVVFSVGGDVIYKSIDAGEHWFWFNNGNNGVMGGSSFNFNPHHPGITGFGFQDKNGAVTTDGGYTWTYRRVSGKSYGHCYGAFSADEHIYYGGLAQGWGGEAKLTYTLDGGETWTRSDVVMNGKRVSYQDPADENILFCYEMRSEDKGQSWDKMKGCEGVFIHDPGTNELYGGIGDKVVRSSDGGLTWETVASVPGDIGDVAIDHISDILFIVQKDRLYKYTFSGTPQDITSILPRDQFNHRRIRSVCVDPVEPNIVYVGMTGHGYCADASVVRSQDSGDTWQVLTRAPRHNNEQYGKDGGRLANWVRVNPETRELWVMGGCYGIWRMGAPGAVTRVQAKGQPDGFILEQNYPNPFNPKTHINYHLPAPAHVNLVIYSLRGEQVCVLERAVKSAGQYHLHWNGTDDFGRPVAGGIYFYRMEAIASTDRYVVSKKMALVR